MSDLAFLTSNKNIWLWHFFRFCHGFIIIFGTQLQTTEVKRAVCIFKCSLPIKLAADFSLTGSLFCISAIYQQNSLPRLHFSLLQLIATYRFINLDTVTRLAHFLAKRNLCISLCVELFFFVGNYVYNTFACAQVKWLGLVSIYSKLHNHDTKTKRLFY